MARDMRPELLSTKAQKIRFWIDDVDVKVKHRLEERVKIVPTVVMRSQTPERQHSAMKDRLACTKSAQDLKHALKVQKANSGFDLDEDVTLMHEDGARSIH